MRKALFSVPNTAVTWMFGGDAREARSLDELLGPDASRILQLLMRRSLRMGVVSREIETVVSGRVLHLAVTASSLGPRRANSGYVLVLDDLTEMLRAQNPPHGRKSHDASLTKSKIR